MIQIDNDGKNVLVHIKDDKGKMATLALTPNAAVQFAQSLVINAAVTASDNKEKKNPPNPPLIDEIPKKKDFDDFLKEVKKSIAEATEGLPGLDDGLENDDDDNEVVDGAKKKTKKAKKK